MESGLIMYAVILCNQGFPSKTNQNMCHCVQTVRNLVQGRGKFNEYEEIIILYNLLCMTHHIIFINSV